LLRVQVKSLNHEEHEEHEGKKNPR